MKLVYCGFVRFFRVTFYLLTEVFIHVEFCDPRCPPVTGSQIFECHTTTFLFLGEEIDRINQSLGATVPIFDLLQKPKLHLSPSPSASEYLLNLSHFHPVFPLRGVK